MICYYHKNCVDGFTAAWLVWKNWPDCQFVPVHYGEPIVCEPGHIVYVVDFSFEPVVLEAVCEISKKVVVLDHHQTAIDKLSLFKHERLEMWLDNSRSGARLTLDYLNSSNLINVFGPRVSRFVDYVQDRDLWQWKLPDSQEWSAGLASYDMDFTIWDNLIGQDDLLIREGRGILRYQKKLVDSAVSHARSIVIGGHKVLCVNATCLMSEIAGRLAEGGNFGACYFVREDGLIQYSLRSRGGFDVAAIAKEYGGGGHRAAAGFTVERIL